MEWAKALSSAPFNLATSGLTSVPMAEFPLQAEELEITGGGDGYGPLLESIARHTGAPKECIVTAEGTSMANHLALAAILEPGDEVLIEQPTYGLLLDVANYLGLRVKRIARTFENRFDIPLPEVEQAITPATRLVVLTNLHNPSGALIPLETMRAIGEMARRVGARVLVDEVYLEMLFDSAPPSVFSLGETFVVTSSLTKTYGLSGLRCGWILAAPELAQHIWRLNDLFAATAAHPAERMSVMAFDHLPQFRERAVPCSPPTAHSSRPFLIREPIWSASGRRADRWFFHVCLVASRKRSSGCCARNTRPRSCRVSSSKCRAISGSALAARRRRCRPAWKD